MFFSFSVGDFLIHQKYGIGRFHSIQFLEINGSGYDFFKIEYKDSSFVYIPNYQLDVLKFHSNKNAKTEIDSLGKSKILKKRAKLAEEIGKFANELMKNVALRNLKSVPTFEANNDYEKFKKECSFELTSDQKNAVDDILNDLTKSIPMDRLLCADVGFGKTEVALNAIAMAVFNNYSALFIAPTTILATQHFDLLQKRFASFNKNIKLLSKLSENADSVKKDWKNGKIDILISTACHKGVENLLHEKIGVVVLDEEHHFGVKFKEEIRKNFHFLQLSATPIPRTLNLALSKIKDISVLENSPKIRNNVELHEIFDDKEAIEIIKNATLNNFKIFLIAPRIEFIKDIEKLIKHEKYVIIHGRLNHNEISKNLKAFETGDVKILIATNIVESGINILDANLMIIFHANMFGLSALHQLKGRIGRDNNSFAKIYLSLPKIMKGLTKDRIETIKENNFIGSNYSLSIKDMSIRGAGTMAADKQSGKDYGFGLETYYEMLSNAIKNEFVFENDHKINFVNFHNAYIPKDFIEDEDLRISVYKKLCKVKKFKEFKKIQNELLEKNEEKEVPNELKSFLEIVCLQILSKFFDIKKIEKNNTGFLITFNENSPNLEKINVSNGMLQIILDDVEWMENIC